MLINEIPDDCLLAIFDHMSHLCDLINCYKDQRVYSSDTVYYREMCKIDSTCLSKLFTNLIIVELSFNLNPTYEDAIEFVKKQRFLKGLINRIDLPVETYCVIFNILCNNIQLEMLSVQYFNPNNLRNGSSIKQLVVRNHSLAALKRHSHYLPNLERLKITIYVPDNPYDGPVLKKLKILELSFHAPWDSIIFYGLQFMDSCPNLQSAHIKMAANTYFFDETLKHKCLQDLVLQSSDFYNGISTSTRVGNENDLKRLLMKYPNLKHLALRGAWKITEEHIEQLFHILPNLVVLDVRKCYEVTQEAADYVKDYCKRYGRSIKFYFDGNEHEIKSDWPQLSIKHEAISLGFDFMKNCFLRQHDFLPNFLIPIDY
ncbi:uncharacterized protein LOC107362158 isoform X2 [Tetranychus urticae]|uniref:uncharacterized protein LOC107362158 isoform X2 n=1 Tax=Tetranychus urticae TaxID=32264 RepID=UPI00077BFAD1|nr:uncharacterized protein LOC107362158 isoform X2 [Tetranychus urticae]